MVEIFSFMGIYFLFFFFILIYSSSKNVHIGVARLLLWGLQTVLLIRLIMYGELRIDEIFVLEGLAYKVSLISIFFQLLTLLLVENTRQGVLKGIFSSFTIIAVICSLGFQSLLLFFISSQLAFYSSAAFIAIESGRQVGLSALRLFIKNEFYAGFFLLFLFLFKLSTGGLAFENFRVTSPGLYSLAVCLFFIYMMTRVGVFPFHSNDHDIIRTGKINSFCISLLISKIGTFLATLKIFLSLMDALPLEHREFIFQIARILGFTTVIYSVLICAWSKDFLDSVGYLYTSLMSYVVFSLIFAESLAIEDLSIYFMIVISLSFSLLVPLSLKYLTIDKTHVNLPANMGLSLIILFTLGGVIGFPGLPGFQVKILFLKSLAAKGFFLEFISTSLITMTGIYFLKFYRFSDRPAANNYTVLKNTIGLQLYSAIVLAILVGLSIKPTYLINN